MNNNDPSPTPESPDRHISVFGLRCNLKVLLAFGLGVVAFFLMFGLGAILEGAALGKYQGFALAIALGAVLGAYFLAALFLLSRGNPLALRNVWPKIIAINFVFLCAPVLCIVFESKSAALGTLLLVVFTVACSYAGAALAARTSRP